MKESSIAAQQINQLQPDEKKKVPLSNTQAFFAPKDYTIPRLVLLDDMVALFKHENFLPNLENTLLIGVQHILETTVTLFDSLHALGLPYENMYFSGKCYSTAPEIEAQVRKRGIRLMSSNKPEEFGQYEKYAYIGIQKMWHIFCRDVEKRQQPVDRVIILDEGGRCLEKLPNWIGLKYKMAAVEQTTAGFHSKALHSLLFPLIDVAHSAVKKNLEPPLIVDAIERKFKEFMEDQRLPKDTIIGVIGNGAIGRSLCRYVLSQGYTVFIYDQDENSFQQDLHKNFYRLSRIEDVISTANYIFGCTGKDITKGIDVLSLVKQDKVFVSCSSEDKEFNSLLRAISYGAMYVDTLSDIVFSSHNRSKITVLRGGFPFNFDRTPFSVPAKSIEVTRGLLLAACIQAITCAHKLEEGEFIINRPNRQCLNPMMQSYVALHWLCRQPSEKYDPGLMKIFEDVIWIQKNSGGKPCSDPDIEKHFEIALTKLQTEIFNLKPKSKF
ncbi:hypothetical protein DLAC_05421 [Tieghemostelium lacteum]|uniref:6-phosphogluconate dehydrogenase NADP-binding domain-containing protein n=1 Tax=Tieghemostelium lacteum TaxID=361077 RepID=A0A151ZFY4_TIELA|nr:hypothetical protein DLAC_05421 [Tieghemostelium lacteum]|eukprot:KYQ92837.1 hypothetical protein DLAC_05421 [Tieghemostelium lacteum]